MKKLLAVIDYQNDFVNGSLGFPKATLIEENICDKINLYKQNNDDVLYTLDTHYEDYLSTQEGKNLPIEHCIKDTDGHKLYGKVAQLFDEKKDKVIEKNTFGSLDFANYLKEKQYDSVELIGLVSNICVVSNAVLAKSALPNALIIVDAKCTAGADITMHEKSLDIMQGLQITVTNRDK